jgi:hypothetical protein
MRVLLVFLFLLLLLPEWLSAQSFYAVRRERNLILTVGSGSANYFGDLVNPGEWGKTRYNILVGAELYFTPRVSARTELVYFRLAGDDAQADDDRIERNLSFFSGNLEFSVGGTVSLLKLGERYYQRPRVNVYGFAGIGLLYTNPKAERENGENVTLKPLQTELVNYSRVQPVIPYGIGVKYMPHPFYNVIVEFGYRTTFTDYLDDVSSTRYVDPDLLKNDLAREMADRRRERDPDYPVKPGLGKRGNPNNNDGYMLLNVKVQYYWPVEIGYNWRHRKLFNRIQKGGGGKPTRKGTN